MCDGFDKVGQVTTGNSPTARPWAAPALWVAVVVLLLIAAACGSTSNDSSLDNASETATSPRADSADEPAPSDQPDPATSESEANLVDLAGGGQLDWNSLQGRDVVLWFWAPW